MLITVTALLLSLLVPLSGCSNVSTEELEPDMAFTQDHPEMPGEEPHYSCLLEHDSDQDSSLDPDLKPYPKQEEPPPNEVFFSYRNYSIDEPILDFSLLNLTNDDIFQLQYMTNMTELRLWGNQIDDLTPLYGLTSLVDLSLGSNQIIDLTPLAGLTNLTRLNLHGNQISDLTPIAGLTNLSELILSNNSIVDLTPLANLTNLKILELGSNQINDLTPLYNITGLEELVLDGNQIRDISPVLNIDHLKFLSLSDNPIYESTGGNPDIKIIERISANVGSIIEFGGYSWLVLDVQDNYAMLITEHLHTIGMGRYKNVAVGEGTIWATCFVRRHLNSEFLFRFNPLDRSRIRQTTVTTENNPRYNTTGGAATEDFVFILCVYEVVKFFGDSGELGIIPTGNLEKTYIGDEYNSARIARYADGRLLWGEGGTSSPAWWLRTPGGEQSLAAVVDGVGNISVFGTGISNATLGTRPVIWLNLNGA